MTTKGNGAEDDLAVLDKDRPYIRSVVAFLIYLRFGRPDVADDAREIGVCFDLADMFVARLKKDVEGRK